MRSVAYWICFLCLGLSISDLSATSIIDFLKYQGITYQYYRHGVGRELQNEDLGDEFTKVKFKFVWDGFLPGKQPDHGPDEAFAAHLDIGTSIFTVKGYLPAFRLAARRDGKIPVLDWAECSTL